MAVDTRTLGRPVDKKAATVISNSSEERASVFYGSSSNLPWSHPIPTVPVIDGMEDLSGKRVGSLTVIGRIDPSIMRSKRYGSYWLVRCDCGNYHKRLSRAIKNPKNKNDMCYECNRLAQHPRSYEAISFFEKHGYYPHQKDSVASRAFNRRFNQ